MVNELHGSVRTILLKSKSFNVKHSLNTFNQFNQKKFKINQTNVKPVNPNRFVYEFLVRLSDGKKSSKKK